MERVLSTSPRKRSERRTQQWCRGELQTQGPLEEDKKEEKSKLCVFDPLESMEVLELW